MTDDEKLVDAIGEDDLHAAADRTYAETPDDADFDPAFEKGAVERFIENSRFVAEMGGAPIPGLQAGWLAYGLAIGVRAGRAAK